LLKGGIKLLLALAVIFCASSSINAAERILCASTTSTQNSGLLDYLGPLFEEKTGIRVDVVAVGTGAAIEIGKRGDADIVLVHAKELELQAVSEGYFVNRRDVMYNDFVVIGPPGDPAKIKEAKSASEAFKKIAETKSPFVSRGDNSGTHRKELSFWQAAGIEPQGESWYMEAGQGMAKTQRVANEKRAYTLTDMGTWLSMLDTLDMKIAFAGDPALFNQYGVMAVNPVLHNHVKYKEAMAFIEWLTSEEGQQAIASFMDARGNRLFTPNYSARD
jgi:tungstate transport system substrate-binding protein